MTILQNSLAVFLVVVGLVTMLTGSAGIIRLPDFFTRTHAASLAETVGIILVLIGLAVYEGLTLNAAKILLAVAFIALASPVGVHMLARAALLAGVKPWAARDRGKEERE